MYMSKEQVVEMTCQQPVNVRLTKAEIFALVASVQLLIGLKII